MNFLFFLFMFVFSLISMIYIRNHILLCLLSLEFLVLSLLCMIMLICLMSNYTFYLYIYFMTFYVCEGVLGLSILVSLIRSHGNDYLNSIMLW
ncbi:NADH dehydrogenase subunit 4L (mitochondrion) [Homalodisca vitripennis]|uniref:NADH-ubiquinone oxidoreductase chain 4L n=1 Tax=Homalodisca vitripennis TaxID=197043 RepID=Q5FYG2_HOMVI|nr:NADH dehydrogenase subunit 4L [Homalodisca vitripennis]AAW69414.1 NADH dehydrogenase subunit 4L [Homalodisca vitripennis]KAG8338750.1 NADH dehydrogenase subunit 4L [Homalodisca vitripennis]